MSKHLTVIRVYTEIALYDGTLHTLWGPCSGDGSDPCTCRQCEHANQLEQEGKDWEVEYQAAMKMER